VQAVSESVFTRTPHHQAAGNLKKKKRFALAGVFIVFY